jgi:methionyl-tRNA formyltransferase
VAQYDWVRAQTDPYPGAYTFHDGTKLTVWCGEPIDRSVNDTQPGEILDIVDGEGVDVRSGDGVFRLRRIKPGDRPSRWADQYAQDADLAPGDRLGREFAPDGWLYTGIQRSTGDTSFDTNLSVGTAGELDLVAFSGSRHSLQVRVTLDERKIFTKPVLVEDAYRDTVEYSLSEPGTYTVTVKFERNGEHIDTRYLKVFVHG